ncbi:AhpC-TSA-domain-containing protein [Hypoxylon argillaceum]|nr:AhpC-TSA-domain-containing protein [Hypoxylon argillaceum]KAI1151794.1 AhpC-TSA-domain-containing protein [Nemania diffusa]
MSQTQQLEQASARITTFPEAIRNQLADGHAKFLSTWDPSKTIQVGDKLPEFALTDATGKEVTSASLLAKGPLLITFYRGEWCPFCNIAIGFLQKHLPEFQSRGVTLVAISPELPNNNMTTTEKHALQFPVLTDLHNGLAKKLGIVYDQSSAKDLHKSIGLDLNARNGDDTWELPIPATLLVDKDGVVRNTAIEPDYKRRLDPKQAVEWIDALQK